MKHDIMAATLLGASTLSDGYTADKDVKIDSPSPPTEKTFYMGGLLENLNRGNGITEQNLSGSEFGWIGPADGFGTFGKITGNICHDPGDITDDICLKLNEVYFYTKPTDNTEVRVGMFDNLRGMRSAPFQTEENLHDIADQTMMSGDDLEKYHMSIPNMVGWIVSYDLNKNIDIDLTIARRRDEQIVITGNESPDSSLKYTNERGLGTSKYFSSIGKISYDLTPDLNDTSLDVAFEGSRLRQGQNNSASEKTAALQGIFHHSSGATKYVAGGEYAKIFDNNGDNKSNLNITYGYIGIEKRLSPVASAFGMAAATHLNFNDKPDITANAAEIGATLHIREDGNTSLDIKGSLGINCSQEEGGAKECNTDKMIGMQYRVDY